MNVSLLEIAQIVQGVVVGDEKTTVRCLASLEEIHEDSLLFVDSADKLKRVEQSNAAAVIVSRGTTCEHKPVIQVAHPYKAFVKLLNYFHPPHHDRAQIHPSAVIAEDAVIGQNVSIGPFTVIEAGAHIGDNCIIKSQVHIGRQVVMGENCILHSKVTVYDACQLGNHVIVHAGSVIGSDGFGYTYVDGEHLKMPHIGNVIIGNEVEIGANSVIDRASMGSTRIGDGTKIDNLVQVAHSVKLGKNNILCAFTGIAGSSESGDNVIFAANVGVADHVRIDDGVILGARTGVPSNKHLKQGNIYLGSPARPKDKAIEIELSTTRIPIMRKTMRSLGEKVTELSQRLAQIEEAGE